MKLKNPHLWIAFFSAVGVVSMGLIDFGRTSPGALAAVHQRESELTERGSCSECHGGWGTTMTQSCLECHEDISGQMDDGSGFHGALEEKAKLCALCHSDHHGEGFAIVNLQSFIQAGIRGAEEFDHAMVDFTMSGEHLEQECSECHENADKPVLLAGERRYIGLEQDCKNCHEDPHEGQMVLSCASCHGQEAFDQLAFVDHDQHLPLTGGHAESSCRDCHAEGDPHSLEILGGGQGGDPRRCQDCHESPHQSAFVAKVAQLVSLSPEASCVTCHEAEHLSFQDDELEVSDELHAASGFELGVPHDDLDCAACHSSPEQDFVQRYSGRKAEACSVCHEDPHGGQFAEGEFAAQECTACHDGHRFVPHAFDTAKHEQAAFVLSGSHLDMDCNECHTIEAAGSPRDFTGTASRCELCHADAHRGFFDRFVEELASVEDGTCVRCHTTTHFTEVPAESFDHGYWTGFQVLGAHAQDDCGICHERSEQPDEQGRTFGWVEEHFGVFEGCVTCHSDPHRGDFNGPEHRQVVDGRVGCARCHVQTSFRSFSDGFDHHDWTGFRLDGKHGEVGCSECHAPLRRKDEFGRTWKRVAGNECSACHEDPHQGQFEITGRSSCRRCHDSAVSFSSLNFNHNRDSRFPLDDQHTLLECAACHKPRVLEDGGEFVRYRPLGTKCVDCHGANEDPLRKRKEGRK